MEKGKSNKQVSDNTFFWDFSLHNANYITFICFYQILHFGLFCWRNH
jgi:hypothetical protein